MPKTILVTGATGYIAKHIVLGLLRRGDHVVGSARATTRDAEMRAALAPHLDDAAALDRYRTVALDLSSDDGWDAAMVGVDAMIHTASPFPLEQPKDPQEVIKPAVDGALRALGAATRAGVRRVVMTSSSAAISTRGGADGKVFTEADWTDIDDPTVNPYAQSKTLAERAAWDFAASHPDLQLTAINPVFVQGPPLDAHFGTSIRVIERIMSGKDPMQPRVGFAVVDVRDVALAHIRALDSDAAIGERFIVSDRFMWFADMAREVAAALPGRKIATRTAPNLLIRLIALFDTQARSITPALGVMTEVSAAKAREMLGISFRDGGTAVRENAQWLDQQGLA